ncbi:hypothetical protein LHK12_15925 [Providencia rettgeri]|nr:hypothetical protein [Providencia rettgeri]
MVEINLNIFWVNDVLLGVTCATAVSGVGWFSVTKGGISGAKGSLTSSAEIKNEDKKKSPQQSA